MFACSAASSASAASRGRTARARSMSTATLRPIVPSQVASVGPADGSKVRHAAHARVSAATAAEAGVKEGDLLAVTGPSGTTELPLEVTEMPDRVVWLPLNSTGGGVGSDTGVLPGALVRIGPATSAADAPQEAPKEVEA